MKSSRPELCDWSMTTRASAPRSRPLLWKRAGRVVADRTVTDAHVVDAVRDIAWTTKVDRDGVLVRKLATEGLYGRRKMTAYLRCTSMPAASAGSVDRAMRTLGLSGVRRDKGIRTTIPAKDGTRPGDLLDRDFTAAAPNRTWATDFTYCRTWAGFVYVAFIVDVYAQRIVAWHVATTKQTDLVMIPLRMALLQRGREGRCTRSTNSLMALRRFWKLRNQCDERTR
jgi:putative transposase